MFNIIKKKSSITNLYDYKDCFSIIKVPNHNDVKNNLLQIISYEQDTSASPQDKEQSISSTDFFSDYSNSYYKEFFLENVIKKYYNLAVKLLGYKNYEILNMWYQQYEHNDTHGWHTHHGCNYSNVYFLELPSKEVSTEFLNVKNNTIFRVDSIREGDLLSFPGHIIHRSPKNITNDRKSVIVFNSNIFT